MLDARFFFDKQKGAHATIAVVRGRRSKVVAKDFERDRSHIARLEHSSQKGETISRARKRNRATFVFDHPGYSRRPHQDRGCHDASVAGESVSAP